MNKGSLAVVAAGTLLLSSCNGEEPTQLPEPGEPEANVVRVDGTEYAFDMPQQVTGGVVTFELANVGGLPHEFAFGRLEEGTTIDDVVEAIEQDREPKGAEDLAGVSGLSPGLTASMTRELEPGTYSFLCFFPSPEGEPHAKLGMVRSFDVTGESGAELPAPDATIVATEDGFEVPDIAAGQQTLELRNEGEEEHEFFLFSLEPGSRVRDVDRWFGSGFDGPAPAVFPGGMQAIPPGASVFLTVELEAGRTYQLEDFESGFREEFTPA